MEKITEVKAHQRALIFILGLLFFCVSCSSTYNPLDDYEELKPATITDTPPSLKTSSKAIEHGRYLVELLGCGVCHTEGALVGEPRVDRLLAGSSIGIAYSNPLIESRPGVVFPGNLTPDKETGIGNWTEEQLVKMIGSGVDQQGHQKLSVMPWPAYAKISEQDTRAIAAYLKALAPIKNRVPENNSPGWETSADYVYFGVYRSFE